jgi:hypothetical protein
MGMAKPRATPPPTSRPNLSLRLGIALMEYLHPPHGPGQWGQLGGEMKRLTRLFDMTLCPGVRWDAHGLGVEVVVVPGRHTTTTQLRRRRVQRTYDRGRHRGRSLAQGLRSEAHILHVRRWGGVSGFAGETAHTCRWAHPRHRALTFLSRCVAGSTEDPHGAEGRSGL